MSKIEKYLIKLNININDALIQMSKSDCRTLIVMDKKKVTGVLSEGDIIRGFINGFVPTNTINEIIQYNFKYVTENNTEDAYDLVKKNLILLLPVVNKNMELIDVITIKDFIK